ncbi:DUF4158 domain-containing protein [Deinococcus roseus]|uniref:DUF4158 domain-containing protein n=1 Tax=Deinococcus roseus TaxID=392414 RepID=A0ABQ2DFF0_9DEIO|nr:DUF4158 domain-containing protein [Deinococcus roseus]GGJ55455.1 hypothetical protein GCM10008938_47020 [Deinococcus roseus]
MEATCLYLPNRLARLIHLLVTRHLHQPLQLKHIPRNIQRHIAHTSGLQGALPRLRAQEHDVPYLEHLRAVREHLGLISFRTYGTVELARVLQGCCTRHEDMVSILNAAVETLHLQHFELPGFTTLVKVATTVRATINKTIFSQVMGLLEEEGCLQLDRLFEVEADETTSRWNALKLDPKKASLSQLRGILSQLAVLEKLSPSVNLKSLVSRSKFEQFVQEAKSLNRQAMVRLTLMKRYTLAVALLEARRAQLRDDLGTLFVRRMFRIRTHALNLLKDLQEKHQGHTDALIDQLRQVAVLLAAEDQNDVLTKVREAIPKPEDTLLDIDRYLGRTRNNFVPFMMKGYLSHRAALLNFLEGVSVKSTSDNKDLEHSIRFVLEHRSEKDPNLSTFTIDPRFDDVVIVPDVPLGWVPEVWRPFVFQHKGREVWVLQGHPLGLSKLYFEMYVLLHVAWELKSGDLCIEGSEDFANYTQELVTDVEMQAELPLFLEQMGQEGTGAGITRTLKQKLQETARWADARLGFPERSGTRIKGETFTLSRMEAEKEPEGFEGHRQRIVQACINHPSRCWMPCLTLSTCFSSARCSGPFLDFSLS